MTKYEFFNACVNGTKIRYRYWHKDDYIIFDKEEECFRDERGIKYPVDLNLIIYYIKDYEIYKKPKETLSLSEALEKYRMVRRSIWHKYAYIYIDNDGTLRGGVGNSYPDFYKYEIGYPIFFNKEDLTAKDWCEYKEVK